MSGSSDSEVRQLKFDGHAHHTIRLAQMCRDSQTFTDCVIICAGGAKVKAHKLVLSSASSFLKEILGQVPESIAEASVVVPEVPERIVAGLVDLLYSGEMTVRTDDTDDLQRLMETLEIDPAFIQVIEKELLPKSQETGEEKEEETKESEKKEETKESEKEVTKESETAVEQDINNEEKSASKRKFEDRDEEVNTKKAKSQEEK